jgi:hypothetical protein
LAGLHRIVAAAGSLTSISDVLVGHSGFAPVVLAAMGEWQEEAGSIELSGDGSGTLMSTQLMSKGKKHMIVWIK